MKKIGALLFVVGGRLAAGQDGSALVQTVFQTGASQAADGELDRGSRVGIKVHVTSVGGVGTTGFIEELRTVTPPIRTNHPLDNDGIKHLPFPKLLQNGHFKHVDKMIYLHGDPARAVMSVDRRGWFLIQARKTRSDRFGPGFPKDLNSYAAAEGDLFQFEKHFDSFREQCEYPIAFLRMNEKTKHLKELAKFLEADVNEVQKALVPFQLAQMAEYEAEDTLAKKAEDAGTQGSPMNKKEVRRIAKDRQVRLMSMYKVSSSVNGTANPVTSEPVYNPDAHASTSDYSYIPDTVKDQIRGKFTSLVAKYNKLPGFVVFTPGIDCTPAKQETPLSGDMLASKTGHT